MRLGLHGEGRRSQGNSKMLRNDWSANWYADRQGVAELHPRILGFQIAILTVELTGSL